MAVKLSREEQYGIMALVDLAYNLGGGPAQVRQIAKRQRIPQRFLEQIFAKLRQADVVVGKRGPRGGYSLAKEPKDIRLEEVMKALRPKLQEDSRTDAPALAELIDTVWSEIEGSFQSTLRGVSLQNLCERAKQLGISDAGEIAEAITGASGSFGRASSAVN
ncbi:MAG TPA: Rrf2 family transcriptional regulator [Oligoflexia bacterium]|nr:Rrf2 family transcriptional regulator [Oligoflexia bacterium]HMP47924.1 Rrf2 family transcriptional regulator [Oligoflexia bacterium]